MSSVRAFAIVVAVIPALLLGGLSGYALRTAPASERSYHTATMNPTQLKGESHASHN